MPKCCPLCFLRAPCQGPHGCFWTLPLGCPGCLPSPQHSLALHLPSHKGGHHHARLQLGKPRGTHTIVQGAVSTCGTDTMAGRRMRHGFLPSPRGPPSSFPQPSFLKGTGLALLPPSQAGPGCKTSSPLWVMWEGSGSPGGWWLWLLPEAPGRGRPIRPGPACKRWLPHRRLLAFPPQWGHLPHPPHPPPEAPIPKRPLPRLTSTLTLAGVVDHGHCEVHLPRVGGRSGADRVVARLQQRHLREEQRGRQGHRRELLQHLHQGRAPVPLPLLVEVGVLQRRAQHGRDEG